MIRSKENLLEILKRQITLLELSCKKFDEGNEVEALQIAVRLRVLLHDTSRSQSLLSQLKYKDKLEFVDSLLPVDPQPVKKEKGRTTFVVQGLPGLIAITFTNEGGKFIAPLSVREGAKGKISFSEWWESNSIPRHENKRYSRKQLTIKMANKEGGTHVHTEIDNAYEEFVKSTLGFKFTVNGVNTGVVNSAVDVSVRQIAWETLETLKQLL